MSLPRRRAGLGSAFGIGGRRQLLGRWQLRLCGGNARRLGVRLFDLLQPGIASVDLPQRPQRRFRRGNSFRRRNAGGSARLRMDHAERTRSRSAGSGKHGRSTSIQTLTAEFTQDPIPYQNPLQFTCNPPNLKSFAAGAQPTSLGQGAFTPLYAQLVNDGNEMIVVSQMYRPCSSITWAMEPPLPFPSPRSPTRPCRSRPPLPPTEARSSSQSAIKVRAESAPAARCTSSAQPINSTCRMATFSRCPTSTSTTRTTTTCAMDWARMRRSACRTWWPSGHSDLRERARRKLFVVRIRQEICLSARQEMTHKREDHGISYFELNGLPTARLLFPRYRALR